MRPIPDFAIDFITRWEGVRLTAYLDVAGIPTIGYGHIHGVEMGQVITVDQAKAFLKADLRDAAGKLDARIGSVVDELTSNQYAALLSFIFNLGANSGWTIWKRLKRREWDQVPLEFMKFVNARDPATGKLVKVKGLVNRRAAEVGLWSTDEPGTQDLRLTSYQTRAGETPPTPSDPGRPGKSISLWSAMSAPFLAFGAWVANAVQAAPDVLKPILDAINPFSEKSPVIQNVSMALYTVLAGATAYVAVTTLQKKKEARS